MKLRVDKSVCAGHALCNGIDERLFPLDDDGYSSLEPHDVGSDEEDVVRAGVASCPESALFLENGD
jgi:ferredoxin